MKWKVFLPIIFVVICVMIFGGYRLIQHSDIPYADVRNQTISTIDVRNDRVIVEGKMHSKATQVTEYAHRIEGDSMYIKIMMKFPMSSKGARTWFFTKEFPIDDRVEKIYFEDEKNKILIWEKSQGYSIFNIEDKWYEELRELK